MAKPTTPPKPADDSDPAPVVVTGPQAYPREHPEKQDADDEPEGDPAPVVVTGPEAYPREKPEKAD